MMYALSAFILASVSTVLFFIGFPVDTSTFSYISLATQFLGWLFSFFCWLLKKTRLHLKFRSFSQIPLFIHMAVGLLILARGTNPFAAIAALLLGWIVWDLFNSAYFREEFDLKDGKRRREFRSIVFPRLILLLVLAAICTGVSFFVSSVTLQAGFPLVFLLVLIVTAAIALTVNLIGRRLHPGEFEDVPEIDSGKKERKSVG